MTADTPLAILEALGLALAIGLLIGMERGWHERELAEGGRIAGLRTFGLVGLLGAISALLAQSFGVLVIGLVFVGYAILAAVAHWVASRREAASLGITTELAGFVAFLLGAAVMAGYQRSAVAVAVVVTLLLGLKPVLHDWLNRINREELLAVLKMLLISVVLLPVLPDTGYGPWQALNPYVIWWMVVLVAGISFIGYFAMRIMGPQRGLLLTSLFGGLVSSTALTMAFSRLSQKRVAAVPLLAMGILVASATMFPRVLAEVAVVNPDLLTHLAIPLGTMAIVGFGGALLMWHHARHGTVQESAPAHLHNPFELGMALRFGLLLAAIMFFANGLKAWLGEPGIYLLAGVSGLADVDALVLSLSKLAREGLDPDVAVQGIVIATVVNTLVKAGLAFVLGGRLLGWRVGGIAVPAVIAGGLTLLLL